MCEKFAFGYARQLGPYGRGRVNEDNLLISELIRGVVTVMFIRIMENIFDLRIATTYFIQKVHHKVNAT